MSKRSVPPSTPVSPTKPPTPPTPPPPPPPPPTPPTPTPAAAAAQQSAFPTLIRLQIETLLGQKYAVTAPRALTVEALKRHIEEHRSISVKDQILVRRRGGEYSRLEESKRLDEYGLVDDECIVLMPAVRSATPGYGLKEAPRSRVFLNSDGALNSIIDQVLKQSEIQRDPNARYLLVQLDGQEGNNFTLLEIKPNPEALMLGMNTSATSCSKSGVGRSADDNSQPRAISAQESRQNAETRSKMKHLRSKLSRYAKERRPHPPSSIDQQQQQQQQSVCFTCKQSLTSSSPVVCANGCGRLFCNASHERDPKHQCRQSYCRQQ